MFTDKVIESGVTPAAATEIEDPLTDWLSDSAIELTPVQPADEPFLYRTYVSTRVEELALTGWNEDQRETFLRMQYEAQKSSYRTQSPEAQYWVIRCNGSAAGRLTIDREPGKIHVVDIAFVPEFRGQGIGTALMRAIQREALQAGKSVGLYVERFNPALRWYERMGFEAVGGGPIYLEMLWRPSGATRSSFQESSASVTYADRID